jgi:hypothetical protein
MPNEENNPVPEPYMPDDRNPWIGVRKKMSIPSFNPGEENL